MFRSAFDKEGKIAASVIPSSAFISEWISKDAREKVKIQKPSTYYLLLFPSHPVNICMLNRKKTDCLVIFKQNSCIFVGVQSVKNRLRKHKIAMTFRRNIQDYISAPLTHQLVSDVLAEYRRPNDKINDLVQNGFLISLRRGLYVPGPELDLPLPHLFVIANHLRGPSYVSLETALAHWGMIPERVYEINSVTLKTSQVYDTPIGRFTYRHQDTPYYSFGLQRVEMGDNQFALIASPEKAVCDKIIATSGITLRSQSRTMAFLLDDLRMDEEALASLNLDNINSWITDAPKASSLQMLVNTLQRL